MNKTRSMIALLVFGGVCSCATTSPTNDRDAVTVAAAGTTSSDTTASVFDAKLAASLGADDYGMKSYVMVVLNTGPEDARITDKEVRSNLFAGHFANMAKLAKAGKLVMAGPFMDGPPKRGLFIFDVATIEEAEALVNTDPTVIAGVFEYEMTKLYASAALLKINEIHESIQKVGIN